MIIAAFDGEEPPYFLTDAMGSQQFVRTNARSRSTSWCAWISSAIASASAGVPDEVGASLFALGAERSAGTLELVSVAQARASPA